MPTRLMVLLALILALVGCRKEGETSASPDRVRTPSAGTGGRDPAGQTPSQRELSSAERIDSPAGPSKNLAPISAAPGASELSAALDGLTQALRRYSAEKQRVPKGLNEVVASGYLKNLPQAPAGKKFAINEKRVEVILVAQ